MKTDKKRTRVTQFILFSTLGWFYQCLSVFICGSNSYGLQNAGEEVHSGLREILQGLPIRAICSPARISRIVSQVSPFRRGGRAGENEGAAVRGDLPRAPASGRGHAASAAHLPGTRSFAHHV